MKRALILGAGGFIGSHMAKRLKGEGYFVRGCDLKYPEFSKTDCDEFVIGDLRDVSIVRAVMKIKEGFDELYQYAADMGGAEYIFTGDHDADLMPNSHIINIHVAEAATIFNIKKLFYASSACMYPYGIQDEVDSPGLKESDAFKAPPDSEYGYEKIMSERLYMAYSRNYGLNIRIARFHNIFGTEGTWEGIRAKAPAALCRKIVNCEDGGQIEVLGDGLQTRSFLNIDECTEGVRRLMESEYQMPINIGSDEMISINDLAKMIIQISGKSVSIKNIHSEALGVRGRNSDNTLIEEILGWRPTEKLIDGITELYSWIKKESFKKELYLQKKQ